MDGLASWVGEELEEGIVMKPVGEGQAMVDWIMEDKNRTVLRRGNKEQLPALQVKLAETGLFDSIPTVVTEFLLL